MAIKKIKTRLGESKWEVRLRSCGRSGRAIRRRFDRKIDAQDYLKRFGSQIQINNDDRVLLKEDTNFSNEALFWLENQKGNCSAAQYNRVKDIISKLLPLVGDTSLDHFHQHIFVY